MKKFLPYIILLLLLSVLMGWYVMNDNQSTVDKKEADFKVKNREKIVKVILHDDQKRTVVLEQKNGVWIVNDKHEAREDLMNQLLEVASRIESQSPVSKAAHENVLREMLASNIRVQIFCDGKTKPTKTYYVGGPTLDNRGTYMLMELNGKPAARPHIVVIPGREGYLTPVYEVEEDVWRNRTLISVKPEHVKNLEITYPEKNYQSFSLERISLDSFKLLNFKQEPEPIHQGILYTYLMLFENVQLETFEGNNDERDFTLKQTPYATIKINTTDGKDKIVNFYYMPVNRRSKKQFDEEGNELKIDTDKLYVSFNNDADFGVAQMYVVGRILRTFEDFLKANAITKKAEFN